MCQIINIFMLLPETIEQNVQLAAHHQIAEKYVVPAAVPPLQQTSQGERVIFDTFNELAHGHTQPSPTPSELLKYRQIPDDTDYGIYDIAVGGIGCVQVVQQGTAPSPPLPLPLPSTSQHQPLIQFYNEIEYKPNNHNDHIDHLWLQT